MNQLTKFSSCSLSNKGKQGWGRTILKVKVELICERSRQKKNLCCCSCNCHINFKSSKHFGGWFEPTNLPPLLNTPYAADFDFAHLQS